MAGGITKPDLFEIRLPADKRMIVGRMDNRPRYMEIGGLGNPGRWNEDHLPHSQSPQKNIAQVEKPTTKVKVAKTAHNRND
ncbi:MAG: hypothetical protein E6J01_04000 [Chloroflexi bacterium]|nr:MAG: hypothetical protein E6J01_04000 [Chloroflexota bacterium]